MSRLRPPSILIMQIWSITSLLLGWLVVGSFGLAPALSCPPRLVSSSLRPTYTWRHSGRTEEMLKNSSMCIQLAVGSNRAWPLFLSSATRETLASSPDCSGLSKMDYRRLEKSWRCAQHISRLSSPEDRAKQTNWPSLWKHGWKPSANRSPLRRMQMSTPSCLLNMSSRQRKVWQKMPPAVVGSQTTRSDASAEPPSASLLAAVKMGEHKTKCAKLGEYRSLRLRHPYPSVWGVGPPSNTLLPWKGASYCPSDSRRSNSRHGRSGGGVQAGDLPAGKFRACSDQDEGWGTDLKCFCHLAEVKTPFRHQSPRAKQALGEAVCSNGDSFFVWRSALPRRAPTIVRLEVGIPALCAPFSHVGLVYFQIRWEVLPLYCTTFRVECVPLLFRQASKSIESLHATDFGATSVVVVGRLSTGTRGWEPTQYEGRLPPHFFEAGQAFQYPWPSQASRQGCLGRRRNPIGAPRFANRYSSVQIFCDTHEAARPPADGYCIVADSSETQPLGPGKLAYKFLWLCSIPACTTAPGEILHSQSIRCFEEKRSPSRKIPAADRQDLSCCCTGLAVLVYHAFGGWEAYCWWRTFLVPAHRCSRRWLRRNIGQRYGGRFLRGVICARYLVAVLAAKVYNTTRAHCSPIFARRRPRTGENHRGQFYSSITRRQHGGMPYHLQHGFSEPGVDERTPSATPSPSQDEDNDPRFVAAFSTQQARGQPEPLLEPSRPLSDAIIAGVRGRFAEVTNRASVLALRGSPDGPTQNSYGTVRREVGGRTEPPLESSTTLDYGHTSQNQERGGSRHYRRAQLDGSALVRDVAAALPRFTSRNPRTGNPTLHLRFRQPGMGIASRGSRDSASRSLQRRIAALVPSTPAGSATISLAEHCFAPSTDRTKTSQWVKFVRFCEQDGQEPLPASEGTLLSYLGHLFEEDRVHGRSVDHYISAIRTRHMREGFADPFATGHHVDLLRAFRFQDDQRGQLQDVRAAIPATLIQRIRLLGLGSEPGSLTEHQAAMVEFQYLLTWREGSVRTVQVGDVQVRVGGQSAENLDDRSLLTLVARPRTLKGRLVRGVGACALSCRHHPTQLSNRNPLGLQLRFYCMRRSSSAPEEQYWARPGLNLRPQVVTAALSACLTALQVVPPPFCTYTSHSLRSGSATAQILINVPLPHIARRGGWRNVNMVANVYYDSRLTPSTEMTLYFWSLAPASSAHLPPPQ